MTQSIKNKTKKHGERSFRTINLWLRKRFYNRNPIIKDSLERPKQRLMDNVNYTLADIGTCTAENIDSTEVVKYCGDGHRWLSKQNKQCLSTA